MAVTEAAGCGQFMPDIAAIGAGRVLVFRTMIVRMIVASAVAIGLQDMNMDRSI